MRHLDQPEAHDIPDEVQKMWRSAVVSKSRAAKNNVFKAFLKSGKSWGRLLVMLDLWAYVSTKVIHQANQGPDRAHPWEASLWLQPQSGEPVGLLLSVREAGKPEHNFLLCMEMRPW